MKKSIVLILIVVALCLTSFTVAPKVEDDNMIKIKLSNGKNITVAQSDLNGIISVSQEEACDTARSFISAMSSDEKINWTEDEQIISIVPMYDTTFSNITAYTIILENGYVVVSAYLDAESIIPEWSDKSEPYFYNLELSSNDKIVYLGSVEYYIYRKNEKLIDLSGKEVEATKLVNFVEEGRSLSNIPDYIFENRNKSTRFIDNPITDSGNYSGGPFIDMGETDNWSNYVNHFASINITGENGTHNPNGYTSFCVPIAITNVLIAYKMKYRNSGLPDDYVIFDTVAQIGINNGYYTPTGSNAGTLPIVVDNYLRAVFNHYNINARVDEYPANPGLESFENLYWIMAQDKAVFLTCLTSNEIYGNHTVMCYGYRRLQGATSGYYLTYLKIADGIERGPRYITFASAISKYSAVANI